MIAHSTYADQHYIQNVVPQSRTGAHASCWKKDIRLLNGFSNVDAVKYTFQHCMTVKNSNMTQSQLTHRYKPNTYPSVNQVEPLMPINHISANAASQQSCTLPPRTLPRNTGRCLNEYLANNQPSTFTSCFSDYSRRDWKRTSIGNSVVSSPAQQAEVSPHSHLTNQKGRLDGTHFQYPTMVTEILSNPSPPFDNSGFSGHTNQFSCGQSTSIVDSAGYLTPSPSPDHFLPSKANVTYGKRYMQTFCPNHQPLVGSYNVANESLHYNQASFETNRLRDNGLGSNSSTFSSGSTSPSFCSTFQKIFPATNSVTSGYSDVPRHQDLYCPYQLLQKKYPVSCSHTKTSFKKTKDSSAKRSSRRTELVGHTVHHKNNSMNRPVSPRKQNKIQNPLLEGYLVCSNKFALPKETTVEFASANEEIANTSNVTAFSQETNLPVTSQQSELSVTSRIEMQPTDPFPKEYLMNNSTTQLDHFVQNNEPIASEELSFADSCDEPTSSTKKNMEEPEDSNERTNSSNASCNDSREFPAKIMTAPTEHSDRSLQNTEHDTAHVCSDYNQTGKSMNEKVFPFYLCDRSLSSERSNEPSDDCMKDRDLINPIDNFNSVIVRTQSGAVGETLDVLHKKSVEDNDLLSDKSSESIKDCNLMNPLDNPGSVIADTQSDVVSKTLNEIQHNSVPDAFSGQALYSDNDVKVVVSSELSATGGNDILPRKRARMRASTSRVIRMDLVYLANLNRLREETKKHAPSSKELPKCLDVSFSKNKRKKLKKITIRQCSVVLSDLKWVLF